MSSVPHEQTPIAGRWKRWRGAALRIAPFMALGPVTGGLTYGMLSCLRAKRPLMASVYGCGLFEATVLLPKLLQSQIALLRGALGG
jgi:hypothetical protein